MVVTIAAIATLVETGTASSQTVPGSREALTFTAQPGYLNGQNLPTEDLWKNPQARAQLLQAIAHSITYLRSGKARQDYGPWNLGEITRERVLDSLLRFRALLQQAPDGESFQRAIAQEFQLYRARGDQDFGQVWFTGYFTPVYRASREPTAQFPYPLYRRPDNFAQWPQPHPTRTQLEGADGLQGDRGPLAGSALVWLENRMDAYIIQVQGSAQLELTDGSTMAVGYGGHTDYPYTSIAKALVADGLLTLDTLSLPVLLDYFQQNPAQLDRYLPLNNRFVFFEEMAQAQPLGSLGVPVTGDRSIATDKSLFPPGALGIIFTHLPQFNGEGQLVQPLTSHYVLDQDTGGAIKGTGRVDLYLGSGAIAEQRAGVVGSYGELYYLLLKP